MRTFILFLLFCLVVYVAGVDDDIEKVFKEHEIIPDILSEAPGEYLKIVYANGIVAGQGNELTPTQAKDAPELEWTVDPDTYYTVIMIDPDIPSRENPMWREWIHWFLVNVPGLKLDEGDVLDPYWGPAAPKTSGLLRYVILVFKQPTKLDFDEPVLNNTSVEGHGNFVTMKFSEKYGMGPPVAGNFYQAKWDEYVPIIHKQFNFKT